MSRLVVGASGRAQCKYLCAGLNGVSVTDPKSQSGPERMNIATVLFRLRVPPTVLVLNNS